jgi:hypothetical protein
MDFNEATPVGTDKVSRYNWQVSDQPGRFAYLKKDESASAQCPQTGRGLRAAVL